MWFLFPKATHNPNDRVWQVVLENIIEEYQVTHILLASSAADARTRLSGSGWRVVSVVKC